MVFNKSFLVAVLSVPFVNALNDWNTPCFQGSCSYDLPDAQSSGSMKVWSKSSVAITDVTESAGWVIIGCDGDKTDQDIRLVCKVPGDAGCAHLYQDGTAVGKLVRLPESCGKGPFARVAKQWDPEDQTIPAAVAAKVVKRDGEAPRVRALALDTKFGLTDPTKWGEVNIAIVGANFQGAKTDIDTSDAKVSRRGFFDKIGGFVKKGIDAISDLNKFDKDLSKQLPPIDINENINLFKESINCGAGPASFDATVSVDASAIVKAQAEIGVTAAGTIIPPKLKDFAIFAGLNADINGELTVAASASATVTSGDITLATIGIPGLTFPGILTIGPSLKVIANAQANLDVSIDLAVTLAYKIENAKFFFPTSEKNANVGSFNPLDTPLKLAVAGNVQARGVVEAHIIPRLDFGIDALGGLAKATVFLNVDASAALTLTLDGSANAAAELGGKAGVPAIDGPVAPEADNIEAGGAADAPVAPDAVGDGAALPNVPVTPPTPLVEADVVKKSAKGVKSGKTASGAKSSKGAKNSGSKGAAKSQGKVSNKSGKGGVAKSAKGKINKGVNRKHKSRAEAVAMAKRQARQGLVVTEPLAAEISGCVDLKAKLEATLGAEGSLFGIFDKEVNKVLFTKEFELFKKCFNASNIAQRAVTAIEARSPFEKRALVCAVGGAAALNPVVDDTVAPV